MSSRVLLCVVDSTSLLTLQTSLMLESISRMMIVCIFVWLQMLVYIPVLVHVLVVGAVLGTQGKSFVSGLLQHVLVN